MEWATSHAFVPTPHLLPNDVIRVYAAFLDPKMVGRIGYVDVDARNPLRTIHVSEKPVLDVGEKGTFDDNGVTPMCIVQRESELWMYYTGWQLGVNTRYYLFTGLAVSSDGGATFRRHSRAPILDRSDRELHVRTAMHVHENNGIWRAWYIAGDSWINSGEKQVPTYNMRHLTSSDGVHWPEVGEVCLNPEGIDEYGFGRPFIQTISNEYGMFYSIRTHSSGYRLGFARSSDGLSWRRLDELIGIDVAEHGWDSQMICFSAIQETRFGTYMFYNGNNYGQTGFGAARLISW